MPRATRVAPACWQRRAPLHPALVHVGLHTAAPEAAAVLQSVPPLLPLFTHDRVRVGFNTQPRAARPGWELLVRAPLAVYNALPVPVSITLKCSARASRSAVKCACAGRCQPLLPLRVRATRTGASMQAPALDHARAGRASCLLGAGCRSGTSRETFPSRLYAYPCADTQHRRGIQPPGLRLSQSSCMNLALRTCLHLCRLPAMLKGRALPCSVLLNEHPRCCSTGACPKRHSRS